VRPILPSATYEQMSNQERDKLPKIIQGISTKKFMALMFEDNGEKYFRIYFRYLIKNFELFFEMNNEFNNMKNLAEIENVEYFDIKSMDSIKDGENYYVFIVTNKDSNSVTLN
jgi:hypothetical protein